MRRYYNLSNILLVSYYMSQPVHVTNARGLIEDRRRSEVISREGYRKGQGERFFAGNTMRG
jgi:hypothetical protein